VLIPKDFLLSFIQVRIQLERNCPVKRQLFAFRGMVGPALESQASASGVLQPETEQTTPRQATIANPQSGVAAGDSNDE
jgi:hypothetical protein